MNKLIPIVILPCTLALYVFDFHFGELHPASQIEVTTETVTVATDEAQDTSGNEISDEAPAASGNEISDEASAAPVIEASTEVETTTNIFLYSPSDLVAEINFYRSSYGLCSLSEDSQLNHAAAVRCNELLASMSHTRPDGRNCSTVYAELGIYPSVWGENLAAGYCSAAGTASDWMSSDGHRANILNPLFTKCGVAHISCDYGYYDYWVILFSD